MGEKDANQDSNSEGMLYDPTGMRLRRGGTPPRAAAADGYELRSDRWIWRRYVLRQSPRPGPGLVRGRGGPVRPLFGGRDPGQHHGDRRGPAAPPGGHRRPHRAHQRPRDGGHRVHRAQGPAHPVGGREAHGGGHPGPVASPLDRRHPRAHGPARHGLSLPAHGERHALLPGGAGRDLAGLPEQGADLVYRRGAAGLRPAT